MLALLIIFDVVVVVMVTFMTFYSIHQYKSIKAIALTESPEVISHTIRRTFQLLMIMTGITFVIGTMLIIRVKGDTKFTPPEVGVVMSSAVIFFFGGFLLADIVRERIQKYFIKHRDFELPSQVITGIIPTMVISLLALIFLEVVVSIILYTTL